ncbi:MAG: ATP-binding cassette domain-containing protein [Gammaproteobacteria bacterium]
MSRLYELTDIEFAYNGDPALAFPSLVIGSSGITAIVGPNGSGKSTLLNLLAFMHPPGRGHIRFQAETAGPADYPQLRRRVGYVQQKPYLFHASVRKNIETGLKFRGMPGPERRRQGQRIIDEFGLGELAERYSHDLSGGEAQKVAIARAMVLQPRVLILDEPFSHLDRSFRRELESMLLRINEHAEATVIFTTHDQMQAQAVADQTVSIFDGHPIPVAMVNLFFGHCRGEIFDTGHVEIHLPATGETGTRLAIDSNQLVLSKQELESSMRNRYRGRITALSEEQGFINVTIQAGEMFQASVTPAALRELGLHIGDEIWVSFKSTAVHLF